MLGCSIKGWAVSRWDGCTIREHPVELNGIFIGWMGVLAMNNRFFGEISVQAKRLNCRGQTVPMSLASGE